MTATILPSSTAGPSTPVGSARRRVLMLTHRLPYPPDRGDRIRSYHLLKLLAAHFDLAVACTSDEPVWLQHHQLLMTMARRVAIHPTHATLSKMLGVAALLRGKPITPACHYRHGLAETILQWQEQQPFDAVLTFCTGMIDYARLLTHPARPRSGQKLVSRHVLDLVDVDSLKWESYARSSWPPQRWVYGAEARRLRRIESGSQDHFDAVTVVSRHEADSYRQTVGDHPGLTVVPNGVDLEYFSPLPDAPGKRLVFVGVLNYWPNAQGIAWFVHQVMPLLRQREPDIQLQIVGRHPTPAVRELGNQKGVEVVGSVPDVREYLRQGTVIIAPLRIARGVQNKVLEAMACARTVVCSPGAAQGIDAVDGEHFLVADSPEQWAGHLTRLLADAQLRGRLGQAGREYVERNHSWEKCLEPMIRLLDGDSARK